MWDFFVFCGFWIGKLACGESDNANTCYDRRKIEEMEIYAVAVLLGLGWIYCFDMCYEEDDY